jgi:hypothetical protein
VSLGTSRVEEGGERRWYPISRDSRDVEEIEE